MRRIRAVASLIVAAAVSACATPSDPELLASLPPVAPQTTAEVDICDLLAEPARFDGRTVLVRGTIRTGIEEALLAGVNCATQMTCLVFDDLEDPFVERSKLNLMRERSEVVLRAKFLRTGPCVYGSKQPRLDVHTIESVSGSSTSH
jgi:hypothetical protein